MALREISKSQWDVALPWVKEANNYEGGGSVRHSVDNVKVYYLRRNSAKVAALRCDENDIGDMAYFMDDDVLKIFKEKFGYTI
jgi:hypothetical protein